MGEGNGQIPTLQPNSINFNSEIRVGFRIDTSDNIVFGNTFSQVGSDATGNFVGAAGSATGDLTIINAGIGYTPASGSLTFTGIALTSITGSGQSLTADIGHKWCCCCCNG